MKHRWICTAMVMALGIGLFTGCAAKNSDQGRGLVWFYPHAATETYGESSDEHYQRVSQILKMDSRGLAEDLDLVFMTDRSTRLTRWHAP